MSQKRSNLAIILPVMGALSLLGEPIDKNPHCDLEVPVLSVCVITEDEPTLTPKPEPTPTSEPTRGETASPKPSPTHEKKPPATSPVPAVPAPEQPREVVPEPSSLPTQGAPASSSAMTPSESVIAEADEPVMALEVTETATITVPPAAIAPQVQTPVATASPSMGAVQSSPAPPSTSQKAAESTPLAVYEATQEASVDTDMSRVAIGIFLFIVGLAAIGFALFNLNWFFKPRHGRRSAALGASLDTEPIAVPKKAPRHRIPDDPSRVPY